MHITRCKSVLRHLVVGLIVGPLVSYGLPNVVRIGGLFENGDNAVEMAFKLALERLNVDPTLRSRSGATIHFVPVIEKLERCDSFQASKRGKHDHSFMIHAYNG